MIMNMWNGKIQGTWNECICGYRAIGEVAPLGYPYQKDEAFRWNMSCLGLDGIKDLALRGGTVLQFVRPGE